MNENPCMNCDSPKTGSPTARTYCTFQLQGGLFGIDALAVKEISVLPPLTAIPHAPAAVRGYVNLRGQIVLVLDLNRLLRLGESTLDSDTRFVVFRSHTGGPHGILVDRIGDMVDLSAERIENTANGVSARENSRGSFSPEELIEGIGKLDDKLLTILDAGNFLPQIEADISLYNKRTVP
jgi:purine-binding chemotaxis protein CheW